MISDNYLKPFRLNFDVIIIEKLKTVANVHQFNKSDIIIDIGENLKFIPLLVKGNIKVLREDNNGNELLLYVLEHGDTCAMSLTCGISKSFSKIRAVADNHVEVISIPINYMQEWFDTNKSWRDFILQNYQIRFDEMLDTIDTLAFLKMNERIYKHLLDKVKLEGKHTLHITHKDIADDLHTSRVVISRLLKQLENENKIKLGRNMIQILNV